MQWGGGVEASGQSCAMTTRLGAVPLVGSQPLKVFESLTGQPRSNDGCQPGGCHWFVHHRRLECLLRTALVQQHQSNSTFPCAHEHHVLLIPHPHYGKAHQAKHLLNVQQRLCKDQYSQRLESKGRRCKARLSDGLSASSKHHIPDDAEPLNQGPSMISDRVLGTKCPARRQTAPRFRATLPQ